MSAQIHIEMHQAHRLWENDIGFWRDDIRAWQHELVTIRAQLKDLESALTKHEETLRQHAASIRLDEEKIGVHEHALAEFERGGEGADLPSFVPNHQQEAERHSNHRAKHEELKRIHHTFVARWRLLVQSLATIG